MTVENIQILNLILIKELNACFCLEFNFRKKTHSDTQIL